MDLLDALNSVIAIPIIPFNGDQIDYDAHAKNIDYLMKNNTLSDNRPRVIALAGTSLLHHVSPDDQIKLIDETGKRMGDQGVLMSAVVPNPIGVAKEIMEAHAKLNRPPDVTLVMPLTGVYSPEGMYEGLLQFGEYCGSQLGSRLLYYYRKPSDRDCIIKLIRESPHFVGVKIGTKEEDVPVFLDGLGDDKIVMWGVGDRSTKAARMGAKGHTSGIAVAAVKASDAINNAQRSGDLDVSQQVEDDIAIFEELRFANERAYNYAAVVEVMNRSGFADIVGGTGGPFNPRIPNDVIPTIDRIVEAIKPYH